MVKQKVTLVSRRSAARTSSPGGKVQRGTSASPTPNSSAVATPTHTTPSLEGSLYVGGAQCSKAPSADELLEAVKGLSTAERKALLAQLSLAVMNESKKVKETRDFSLWCTAVHYHLEKVLRGGCPVLLLQQQLLQRSSWDPVDQFMEASGFTELCVADRTTIYHLLGDLLVTRCRELAMHRGFALSVKVVATNCQHIAGIFEAAFPGYIESGLIPMLIKRVRRMNDGEAVSTKDS